MRFISVFAAFVAALVSILLIFGCYKEKTAIENNGGLDDVKQRTETYKSEITALQKRLEELQLQKEAAQETLTSLENRENYKTNPTAFLTFDGSFTNTTQEILKILDENGLKGTFFVVGKNLENNADLQAVIKKALATGHQIGIRSYSDDLSEIYASEDAYFEDLYACRDLIKEITGVSPVLVRMPAGTATAEVRFEKYTGSEETLSSVLARLEKEGFMVNDWTVDTNTATISDIDTVVSETLNRSSRTLKATYKTCVVLFTDNTRAAKSLTRIITGLKDQGYSFAELPEGICITRQR